MNAPIIIAAGGTGGHFFPAEALAAELNARGETIILLTDARSGGLSSSVFAKSEQHIVSGAGVSGRTITRAAQGLIALVKGIFQARQILTRLRPRAIFAFGGYPAIPPVIAGWLTRPRPLIILHEQNAVLGRANRLLAYMADRLVLSFAETSMIPRGTKTNLVGNPVRPAIIALHGAPYAPPTDEIRIFVIGGSLGAKVFSTLIPQALALLPENIRACLSVTQQCRADDTAQATEIFERARIRFELSPFFDDVPERLKHAHLVIARSGASTVAELAAIGRPAIFIPLPNAIDDHQRANALAMQRAGGAIVLDQSGLTSDTLRKQIEILLQNTQTLSAMAQAAGSLARIDAAKILANCVEIAT